LQTGIDKTVKYIGIIMEKHDASIYPKYELPEGFSFARYQPGFDKQWALLNFEVDHTETLERAEKIFREEFLEYDSEALKEKMVFAVDDETNNLAGVGAVWDGNLFGEIQQRLHWIAVSSKYQNRGIAKAVISKLFDIYNDLGYNGYIYLTSQTWSYKALNIYMQFGFKPYMSEQPVNWTKDPPSNQTYEEQNAEAWKIISEKLKQYNNKN
jgi:GNAT superfamily N-acetyltransferase